MSSHIYSLADQGKTNHEASLKDYQSIIINAPIQRVWDIISAIDQWSNWNPLVKSSKKIDQNHFDWKVGKTKLSATIRKNNPPLVFSWISSSLFSTRIHVWKLEKTEESQTIATVEESIEGFLIPLFKNHNSLHVELLTWLSQLKLKSEENKSI
jgi:uncharacterized membrane protein